MFKRRSHVTALALMVFIPCIPACAAGKVKPYNSPPPVVMQRLHLGFEKPGVVFNVINLMPGGAPVEPSERIQAVENKKSQVLNQFVYFRGRVSIKNSQQALDFVRLQTSLSTWFMWPGADPELEIIPISQVGKVHDYGWGVDEWDMDLSNVRSGCLGVLSDADYKRGYFGPATVVSDHDRFVITRWLFTTKWQGTGNVNLRVLKIRETVEANGTYSRTVLVQSKAPAFADWQVPPFM